MQCNVLTCFGNQLTMYFVLPEVLFVINESAVYWTTSNYLAGQLNLVFGDQLPILENIGILFTGVFTKCKFGYLQHCIRENSRLSLSGRFQKVVIKVFLCVSRGTNYTCIVSNDHHVQNCMILLKSVN